jgi:hypothetical protein
MALASSANRQQLPKTMLSTYMVLSRRNQSSSCQGQRQAHEHGHIVVQMAGPCSTAGHLNAHCTVTARHDAYLPELEDHEQQQQGGPNESNNLGARHPDLQTASHHVSAFNSCAVLFKVTARVQAKLIEGPKR